MLPMAHGHLWTNKVDFAPFMGGFVCDLSQTNGSFLFLAENHCAPVIQQYTMFGVIFDRAGQDAALDITARSD